MLAFILDSCKHYWVSIQRGRAGHCSQARQVFWAGFCFFSVIVIIVIIICSIQSGGHCSQVRQVFVGCLQKEANKETATHKKGFSCKLLQNCPQVISPGPKLKPCSLSGKIKVMQSECGVAQERLEKLQSHHIGRINFTSVLSISGKSWIDSSDDGRSWQRTTCGRDIGRGLDGGRLQHPHQHHHQHHHCHDKDQLAEWILVAFAVLMVDKSKARWKRHLCQDSQLNRGHLCPGAQLDERRFCH